MWLQWGEQISRLPWTQGETEQLLKTGYLQDERAAISVLGARGSSSCSIYLPLHLNRGVVIEALRRFRPSRFKEVALAGIICATQFTFFE